MQKAFAIASTLLAAWIVGIGPTGVAPPAAAAAPGAVLTEGPRLASIYDMILQGQISEARATLARTCPPAPGPACDALGSVASWWEIQQNPFSRQLDAAFERTATAAVTSATAWTAREPNRAEAWFYLAGSYAPLSQWRAWRGEKVAAARDGKRIKDALERALALDGRLQDAYFGIGLYHYYADVVPTALKFLRILMLLPGGDRVQGMQEMLRARDQGELLRGEADYQMHWLYIWYEHRPDRALELLQGLAARYPTNPIFAERIAEVQHLNLGDHRASAATWQQLLERAAASRVTFARIADARARVGLSNELTELGDTTRAIDLVAPILRDRPLEPYGIVANAQLALGRAYTRNGDRANATAAFTHAIESAPRDDAEHVRTTANDALARLRSQR